MRTKTIPGGVLPDTVHACEFKLRLYIAGATPRSSQAVVQVKKVCEQHFKNRCEIEVVDLLDNPGRATGDQVIAAPTLIRLTPLPERRLIGDFSQTDRILDLLATSLSPASEAN